MYAVELILEGGADRHDKATFRGASSGELIVCRRGLERREYIRFSNELLIPPSSSRYPNG